TINGWLFPDGGADALAAKIQSAIARRDDLPGVGRAARRVAESRADWKRNFGQLLVAYQQTVRFGRKS
ncbi:MAG TPA: hypothetical protein DCZ69_08355, partial [Syntrophobacteraceae bacterium]|nr:hypothetical protein [Syntrophobacteraceae bacterium]